MEDKFLNPRQIYLALTVIVFSIPCLVLVGWQFNIHSLKSVLPHFISMNPLTAFLFIFSGISLMLLQEHNSEKSKNTGRIIGLVITKQFLEIQQGNISVESEINIGTTFRFAIPYHYSKTNGASLPAGVDVNNYKSLFTNKKFLIVEDNEVNQRVIKQVLQRAGGAVDIVSNGLEAISQLKKNKAYNLIIMDLQMPKMDGYAATKYIRNVMKLSIPIIAMTASALKGEKSKCIEIGMNDYLSKPFDISFIYKRISMLLGETPVTDCDAVIEKPDNENLFDLCLLEEMDDNEYMSDILGIFLATTPGDLKTLGDACTANQFDTIYKMAHKLKSSAGLLQANQFLAVLIKLEETAKTKKAFNILNLFKEINIEYKKIEIPLQLHLTSIKNMLNLAV